jgi:hypothetical protein
VCKSCTQKVEDIDREWAVESQKYLARGTMPLSMGGGAYSYVPTHAGSIGYLVLAIFCLIGIVFLAGIGAGPYALCPILPLAWAVGSAIYDHIKANTYEQAYAAYQRRRVDVLGIADKVEGIRGLLTDRLGSVPTDIAAQLAETQDLDVLQAWLLLAGQAPTLDDFRKEAGMRAAQESSTA